MLEADHDIELADGGLNDDPAYFVTRCLDCHDDKTEEQRMARTGGTTSRTKAPRNARARATAQLPDPPPARDAVTTVLALALGGGAAVMVLRAFDMRDDAHLVVLALAALAVLRVASYLLRLRNWKRLSEAQRVFEALAKSAGGLAHAARKDLFKVTAWANVFSADPREVTIQYGPKFDPGDPRAWDDLATAFAHALTVPTTRVSVTRMKKGRARLTVLAEADARAHAHPDRAPADEPATIDPGHVAARISDALGEVLEGCAAEVTASHPDGAPARVVVTYPPAATKAARESRGDLPVLMGDTYAPRTKDGRWAMDWNPEAGRFVLTDEPDPLAPIVELAPIDPDIDVWAGVNIGAREGGEPWLVPLLGNQAKHTLIAGQSGAGKGSVLWGIVRGLTGRISNGTVRLWALDPKNQDLVHAEPIAYRCAFDTETVIVHLREAVEAMHRQADVLKRQKIRQYVTPTQETPFNVILVDEIANLTVLATPQEAKEVNALLGKLLTMGRSAGFTVIAGLQNPSKETLKLRDLFNQRIGMSLAEAMHVDMVLGRGARANGAFCDTIDLPGVCYVTVDGVKGHMRTRAAKVSDEEIERITAPARPAPEHAQRARTEQLPFPDDARARGGEPVAIGEVLADANARYDAEDDEEFCPDCLAGMESSEHHEKCVAPLDHADDARAEKRARAEAPVRTARPPAPIPMHKLEGGEHGTLPQDDDPVTIVTAGQDPEHADSIAVTYIYDGEWGEKEGTWERGDIFLPC